MISASATREGQASPGFIRLTSRIVPEVEKHIRRPAHFVRDGYVPQCVVRLALHEEGGGCEEELDGTDDGGGPHDATVPGERVEDPTDEADHGHLGDAESGDRQEGRRVVPELRHGLVVRG